MFDILGATGLTQVEAAWALNVTQPSISRWLRGDRTPSAEVTTRMSLVEESVNAPYTSYDAENNRGAVIVPDGTWTHAFAPKGMFRLPQHIHWSGSDAERILDADDPDDRIRAYMLVITNGRPSDIRMWVDLADFAGHFEDAVGSRRHLTVWKKALQDRGLI